VNDGKGVFKNSIDAVASGLAFAGMVTDALAADINNDGETDLIVAGEWSAIQVWLNKKGRLINDAQAIAGPTQGWWNVLCADDFDKDGDIDLVGGNYGLNHQFNVSPTHSAHLLYKDFNNDGQIDPFFCYSINGIEYPFASRDEALGQVASLKPRFVDYNSYANATLQTIFRSEELADVRKLSADNLKTVHAIAAVDVDADGDSDLIMGGNESLVRVRIGKSDANQGLVLRNDGKGNFQAIAQSSSGLNIRGDLRELKIIKGNPPMVVAGILGDSVRTFTLNR
jgi:hypothetical protein